MKDKDSLMREGSFAWLGSDIVLERGKLALC